jgi:D-inositol-3-phosphate glycosyltransferase
VDESLVSSTHQVKEVVLIVGHCGIPTGFARVLRNLILELQSDFELYHFAINLGPEALAPPWPCRVHCNPNLKDLHDPQVLLNLVDSLRPKIVLMLDEPWACARLMPALRLRSHVGVVLYLAVHGSESLPREIAAELATADRLVAFTENGAKMLREAQCYSGDGAGLAVIPHGVDTNAFFPLRTIACPERPEGFATCRSEARRQLFLDSSELLDSFIVLNANRNQPNKRIDLCLEGFALFARGKPENVKLYLHMGSRPARLGEMPLADRLEIRSRLLPLHAGASHPEWEDGGLNLLYNACDVGINTSEREGWGLVSFEHAATGAAQIVPNHSSCAELWKRDAVLLDTEEPIEGHERPLRGGTVRVKAVAEALEALYEDAAFRADLAGRAYRLASSSEYQWATIGRSWIALLKTLASH